MSLPNSAKTTNIFCKYVVKQRDEDCKQIANNYKKTTCVSPLIIILSFFFLRTGNFLWDVLCPLFYLSFLLVIQNFIFSVGTHTSTYSKLPHITNVSSYCLYMILKNNDTFSATLPPTLAHKEKKHPGCLSIVSLRASLLLLHQITFLRSSLQQVLLVWRNDYFPQKSKKTIMAIVHNGNLLKMLRFSLISRKILILLNIFIWIFHLFLLFMFTWIYPFKNPNKRFCLRLSSFLPEKMIINKLKIPLMFSYSIYSTCLCLPVFFSLYPFQ